MPPRQAAPVQFHKSQPAHHMKHALTLINPKSKLPAAEVTLMKIAGIIVSVSIAIASLALTGCVTAAMIGAFSPIPSPADLADAAGDVAGEVAGANKRREKERLAKLPLEEQALESPGPFPIIKSQHGLATIGSSTGSATMLYESSAKPDVLFRKYDEHFRAYGYRLIHDDMQSGKRTYQAETVTVELRIGKSGRWYSVQAVVSRSAPRPTC